MARDYETDRRTGATVESAPSEPELVASTSAGPTFTSSGPIPPVEITTSATTPTASDRAFSPDSKRPGVKAVLELFAKGTPEPMQVVDVIDAHRDDRDAILATLEATAGHDYVQQVHAAMGHLRASVKRRELVAGDPNDPDGGFFIGSQAEQGARWRTAGGRFTGTAGKDGLDSRYRLDSDDALHAHVGKDGSGALAWERDGKNQGELYGSYHGGKDYEAGVRRTWDVGGGALTTGARHKVTGDGATDGVFGSYRTADGKTTTDAALGVHDGQFSGSAGVTTKPTAHDTVAGSIAHDDHGTTLAASGTHGFGDRSISGSAQLHHGPDGTTGSIAGSYQDKTTHVDGSVTRGVDRTSLHLGASEQVTPELSVSGHLDHVNPDHGSSQTTLGLSERYRSGKVVEGLDLEAGKGERDYFKSTGSVDAQLGKNLYGGAFGSYQLEAGHQSTAQLGASLTFTPSEKTALTLAGVLDQTGALETRLQLDVFKSRISNVGDLADHKKDALVSLFVSYSMGGQHHMLDDRFGAPQVGVGGDADKVMAGIRIKF